MRQGAGRGASGQIGYPLPTSNGTAAQGRLDKVCSSAQLRVRQPPVPSTVSSQRRRWLLSLDPLRSSGRFKTQGSDSPSVLQRSVDDPSERGRSECRPHGWTALSAVLRGH
eukprot:68777-Hanusia_phi.AAC.1